MTVRLLTDDLGAPCPVPAGLGTHGRVVSLVPSLTETIAATAPAALVGATDWCTHPAGLDVTRVRGTKNPDLAAIVALRPDVVVCNQEENRELDVRRLREHGVSVWVSRIDSVAQALDGLRRLVTDVLDAPVPEWLTTAERVWAEPVPHPVLRAVVPIWRDPWMVIGRPTFTADLLARLGIEVVSGSGPATGGNPVGRYPHVDLSDLIAARPDLVILPDEPYAFTTADGPEAFSGADVRLVSGRALTWYGPSMATSRAQLLAALRDPGLAIS